MEPYLGQITLLPYQKTMSGWHLCDGALLTISSNQALFSLLGTAYGGDGKATFGLPDLRGRVPVGFSRYDIAFNKIGQAGGTETVTLNTANMPAHTHPAYVSSDAATSATSKDAYYAGVELNRALYATPSANNLVAIDAVSVLPEGGGAAHQNMQPFQVLAYYIATSGIYPPRP